MAQSRGDQQYRSSSVGDRNAIASCVFLMSLSPCAALIVFLVSFCSRCPAIPLNECAARNSQIADRLPFTGDTLVSSKIGKIVRKLAKDAPIQGECFLLL